MCQVRTIYGFTTGRVSDMDSLSVDLPFYYFSALIRHFFKMIDGSIKDLFKTDVHRMEN